MTLNLVERAKQLAPAFAATAAEDAKLRRLSDDTWKLLLDNGFLRALQPARWGGGEIGIVEFLDAIFEIARASPSAGWVAGVIGVHPWQLALFDERAQRDMWGDDPATMHSSSYNPTGKAEPVDGGYRLSGRWSFSSGCDHCRGVNLGANVGSARSAASRCRTSARSCCLPASTASTTTGTSPACAAPAARTSSSTTRSCRTHRTQSHLDYAFNQPLPGQRRTTGALYRLPWSVVFNMAVAASMLGSARGFVDAWIEQNATRRLGAESRRGRCAAAAPARRRDVVRRCNDDALHADATELIEMAQAREPATMALRAQIAGT